MSDHSRNDDPDTSHDAGESVDRARGCLVVIQALQAMGGSGTAAEIDRYLGFRSEHAHKRLSDCLKNYHWVDRLAEKRKSLYSNRQMYVHTISAKGYEVLAGQPTNLGGV